MMQIVGECAVMLAEEVVAKSKKALNHKDTKAQRKPFLSPGHSLSRPGKNFVSSWFHL